MPEDAQVPDTRGEKKRRNRTTRFVTVFVISVLVFLTGYRYLIHTPVNDWYLFQVARNTVSVLHLIGDEATLEDSSHLSAEQIREARAAVKAWGRGEDAPTPAAIAAASDAPLTPWERYMHRLARQRRSESTNIIGPRVSFTWRAGLTTELFEAENRLRELNTAGDLSSAELIVARREARDRRDELRAALRAANASGSEEDRHRARGDVFHFIVVAECGAIEVMAIFLAAVLAFPTTWRKRCVGIFAGIPIMYFLNIFRLSCLAIIGALDHGGKWFNFAHEYVWQSVYIIFVVVVWLGWIEFVVRRKS